MKHLTADYIILYMENGAICHAPLRLLLSSSAGYCFNRGKNIIPPALWTEVASWEHIYSNIGDMILRSPFAHSQKQTLFITCFLNCVWGSSSKYIIHKMVYMCVLNQM